MKKLYSLLFVLGILFTTYNCTDTFNPMESSKTISSSEFETLDLPNQH